MKTSVTTAPAPTAASTPMKTTYRTPSRNSVSSIRNWRPRVAGEYRALLAMDRTVVTRSGDTGQARCTPTCRGGKPGLGPDGL